MGSRGVLGDGRVFYYARNATAGALTLGEVIVTATVTPDHHDQTVNAATDFRLGLLDVVLNPAATAIVLEEYDQGYVFISDSTGRGINYQIQTHAGNAGSAQSTAKLYHPVVVATGAGSTVSLVRNPYSQAQQSNTTVSEVPVGIPMATLAAAAGVATATAAADTPTFGWLQTWGPCPVLCGENIAAEGRAVAISSGTLGAGDEDDNVTTVSQEFIVGYNLTPFVNGEQQMVDLRIRP